MDKKKLIGLAVILAVLVGLVLFQKQSRSTTKIGETDTESTLLEGIDLNAISKIAINKGTNMVELAKKEGKWVVATLFDHPADFAKLAGDLRKLAEVKAGQPVRSGNVDPSEFGFGADVRKMVFYSSSGEVLTSIEVGARREGSSEAGWAGQHFVRMDGKETVLLVDHNFQSFSHEPKSWITTELLNVPSGDIASIKVADVELKAQGGDWKLTDLDKETEEYQTSEANKLRRALNYLHCKSVADPAKSDKDLGFDAPVEYVAETKDNITYTLFIGGEVDDGRYIRLSAAYQKPEPPTKPEEEDKQEAYKKELEDFEKKVAENKKKADDLNAKVSGWTYIIGNHDAEDMLITRDKLVKEKEKPKEEGEEEKKEESSATDSE